MTNSTKMTLEERIVQSLKDDTLMKLVGDEDAITELVKRSINESLFKNRTIHEGYTTKTVDSPVMAAAHSVSKDIATRIGDLFFEEIMNDPERKRLVYDALIGMIPSALQQYMNTAVANLVQNASMDSMNKLRETLRSDPHFLTR